MTCGIYFQFTREQFDILKKYIKRKDFHNYVKINNEFIRISFFGSENIYVDNVTNEYIVKFHQFLINKNINASMYAYHEDLIQSNDIDLLKYYIKNNSIGTNYNNILYNACEYDNLYMIKYLLKKVSYSKLLIVLKLKCLEMKLDVIELFLKELKKDKDFISDISNKYLIWEIIKNDDPSIIELFIDYGLDLQNIDHYNICNLLTDALKKNLVCIANFLIEKGANSDNIDWYILWTCCHSNHFEFCEFILEKLSYDQEMIDDIFIGFDGYTGVENSNPEIVELLIDHGANVKKYGRKLRKNAKKVKNYHLVEYLDGILNED